MNDKDKWYTTCKFIHDYMQFYSYQDFMAHREALVSMYNAADDTYKYLYQWYVFANPNISAQKKEIIWDILNGNIYTETEGQDE